VLGLLADTAPKDVWPFDEKRSTDKSLTAFLARLAKQRNDTARELPFVKSGDHALRSFSAALPLFKFGEFGFARNVYIFVPRKRRLRQMDYGITQNHRRTHWQKIGTLTLPSIPKCSRKVLGLPTPEN
jgi:hypothetical protein